MEKVNELIEVTKSIANLLIKSEKLMEDVEKEMGKDKFIEFAQNFENLLDDRLTNEELSILYRAGLTGDYNED